MADEPKPAIPAVRIVQEIPAIFIDGVMSHAYAFGVSKLYLSRSDPAPAVDGPNKEVVVAQVIMPTENFVKTVAFLEHRLKTMVETKAVTQDMVDIARQYWLDQSKT